MVQHAAGGAVTTLPPSPPLILVVDDAPDVRLLCKNILGRDGFRSHAVDSGEAALAAARELSPDCILLDVQMPHLDGYEVCRRLKADPQCKDIPILFLTATADDAKAVVEGLAAGGNDYIGKPIDRPVLLARLSVALRLRAAEMQERRARQAAEATLRDLRRARDDLASAHKMTGLAVLAAGLAHEINSPLSALAADVHLLREEFEAAGDAGRVEILAEAGDCCARISAIVTRMRALGESARKGSTAGVELVGMLRTLTDEHRRNFGGTCTVVGSESATVDGVHAELREAFSAILENAFVASTSARGADQARVEVDVEVHGAEVRVRVSDNGDGIPDDDMRYLFDPFFTRKPRWRSLGLGLGVALSIVSRHGGRLELSGKGPFGGAQATLTLPILGFTLHDGNAPA